VEALSAGAPTSTSPVPPIGRGANGRILSVAPGVEGGDIIDRVLRMRMATLDEIWVAWRAQEIDGWETHGTRLAFEEDRRRRNRLVLAGYTVLNFTYRQLVDEPEWVIACIRRALR
jgi:hypothetical protein